MTYSVKEANLSNLEKFGEVLNLSDGSSWIIDIIGRTKVSIWLPNSEILVIKKDKTYYLANINAGEIVSANPIEV